MTIHTVLEDMPDRLKAAAEQVKSTKAAHMLAVQHRNALVVAAVDAGMAQAAVARFCGVQQPQVNRILAKPDVTELDAA